MCISWVCWTFQPHFSEGTASFSKEQKQPFLGHSRAFFTELRGKKPYPKQSMLDKKNQKCLHKPLTKRVHRKGQWFSMNDPDFLALFKIITNTRLSNDMKHCKEFLHTGALESFHSCKLKYLPKINVFKWTHISSWPCSQLLSITLGWQHPQHLTLGQHTLSVEKIPVVMWPLGGREAMFLNNKIIDRQDFTRNFFNRSYFFAIFALDYSFILLMIHLQSCNVIISV